jgi:AcrR family transcriptional regulator
VPRGVAIPEIRQQLFDAAEGLLGRDGPHGLSSRAVTTAAGCAKGLLHNHFGDFDGFLAEFVRDRFARALEKTRRLTEKAGIAGVAENLAAAATDLFASEVATITTLVMTRPAVRARVHEGDHGSLLDLAPGFVAYLSAEQRLGRVDPAADLHAAVLALLSAAHQIFHLIPEPRGELRRVAEVIAAGISPRHLL